MSKYRIDWENTDWKIIWENPEIQGFQENIEIQEDGILHFYYTMKLYRKKYLYLKNDESDDSYVEGWIWKKVCKASTYDFPAIISFRDILKFILKATPDETWMMESYNDGEFKQSLICNTEGFVNEDYYEVRKEVASWEDRNIDKTPFYWLTVGSNTSFRSTQDITGSKFHIKEKDLILLLEKVEEFISKSIELHNKEIKKRNKLYSESLCNFDGHLYLYEIKEGVKTLSNIFRVGDFLRTLTTVKDNQQKEFSGEIQEIKENSLIIKNNLEIPFNEIVYIWKNVEDNVLKWNPEEIKEDFFKKLSSKEKDIFININQETLINQYIEPLINEYWMCREEHNFDNLLEDNNYERNANVYAWAKKILLEIRQTLEKCNWN